MGKDHSYRSIRTVNTESREALVLSVYKSKGTPLTDREVMEALEMHDPNMVRPRITRLIAKGILKETGSRQCPSTNRLVRTATIDPLQHPGSGAGSSSFPATCDPSPGTPS